MKVGDRVKVWNNTISGKRIVEGMATIVRLKGKANAFGQRAMVHFDGDSPDQVVERNIMTEEEEV